MSKHRRLLIVFAVTALLAGSAAPAHAEFQTDASHAPVVFDLLIMRPAGLAFGAVSLGLFVPVGALTLMIRPWDIAKPWNALVVKPFSFVFIDPIGEH